MNYLIFFKKSFNLSYALVISFKMISFEVKEKLRSFKILLEKIP